MAYYFPATPSNSVTFGLVSWFSVFGNSSGQTTDGRSSISHPQKFTSKTAMASIVDGANHLVVQDLLQVIGRTATIARIQLIGEEKQESLALAEGSTLDQGHQEFAERLSNNGIGSSINMLRLPSLHRSSVTLVFSHLTHCTNLQKLDLGLCRIGDDGVAALARVLPAMTALEGLRLNGNLICDFGAVAVADCLAHTNMKRLNLCGNRIGDGGIAALGECLGQTKITFLNLSENVIGDNGIVALAAFLPFTNKLQTLDLSWNSIGKDGMVALISCLKENTSLLDLNCDDNPYSGNNPLAKVGTRRTFDMYTNLNRDIIRMVEENRSVSASFLWRIKQESHHRNIPVDVIYHVLWRRPGVLFESCCTGI